MVEPIKHKRGAPRGNHNAVKHGFYSSELNRIERNKYRLAADMQGISEEITLLRYEIRKAVTGGNDSNLVLLIKAADALRKLVRTEHRMHDPKEVDIQLAFENIFRDFYGNFPEPQRKELLLSVLRHQEKLNTHENQ
jgi:hypothetical protein